MKSNSLVRGGGTVILFVLFYIFVSFALSEHESFLSDKSPENVVHAGLRDWSSKRSQNFQSVFPERKRFFLIRSDLP